MTCAYSEKLCFFSCQPTEGDRQAELLLLLNGQDVATNCDGDVSDSKGEREGMKGRRKQFLGAMSLIFIQIAIIVAVVCALLTTISASVNYWDLSKHYLFRCDFYHVAIQVG